MCTMNGQWQQCRAGQGRRQGHGVRVRGVVGVTEEEMRKRLEALRLEHRDLDVAIDALSLNSVADQLQVARLKKRKLLLRDQIAMLEDYLIPDIIA
jgi:hypothetical protein